MSATRLVFLYASPSGIIKKETDGEPFANSQVRTWFFQSPFYYSEIVIHKMVSQTTGVLIVCSIACWGEDRREHQSSVSLAFVRGIYRWISRTKGKGRGKCFHLMTSSGIMPVSTLPFEMCHSLRMFVALKISQKHNGRLSPNYIFILIGCCYFFSQVQNISKRVGNMFNFLTFIFEITWNHFPSF